MIIQHFITIIQLEHHSGFDLIDFMWNDPSPLTRISRIPVLSKRLSPFNRAALINWCPLSGKRFRPVQSRLGRRSTEQKFWFFRISGVGGYNLDILETMATLIGQDPKQLDDSFSSSLSQFDDVDMLALLRAAQQPQNDFVIGYSIVLYYRSFPNKRPGNRK